MRVLLILAIAAALYLSGFFFGVLADGGRPLVKIIDRAVARVEAAFDLPQQWERRFFEDTSIHTPADCPKDALVILTGGQSNAANYVSDLTDADPTREAFMFYEGACYLLADPVLGATGRAGSLWTPLGHALEEQLGRPVVFLNGAVNATRFEDWLNEASGFFGRLERTIEAADAQGLRPDLVIWHQGESDAIRREKAEVYQAEFERMVARIFELDLDDETRMIVMPTSVCWGVMTSGNPTLIDAQKVVIAGNPRLIEGPTTDQFGWRERYDDCHFSGRGAENIRAALLPLILAELAGD